jgi:hypothetical protein
MKLVAWRILDSLNVESHMGKFLIHGECKKGRFTADIRRIYSIDQRTVDAD